MLIAPLPPDEAERLEALRKLLILDTPPEERFDRITQFARFELDVPIVLISLIDTDRQWFKSCVGLDVSGTPRDISFCSHTILQDEIMVVEDTLKDERFFDNPLVTNAPFIRFYAGAPLILPNGKRIGTLCAIDKKPNSLDALGLSIFSTLRNMVVAELIADTSVSAKEEMSS